MSKTLSAVISGNHIVLDSTAYGGIDGDFVDDALVLNNTIAGSGIAGICLGSSLYGDTAPNSDTGWQIIGNDVSGVTATQAPIWLGLGASRCLVVGGKAPTTVLDQGTHDILIHVHVVH